MNNLRSISAIMISMLLLAACSSKAKNAASASSDPAADHKRATIPVKVIALVQNQDCKDD